MEVFSGLEPGEMVVTEGSFFLRAERERLGLAPPAAASPPLASVEVIVSERGYEPERVHLRAGVPARIVFKRTTDKTCGTEVVIPSLNVRRELPLNEPVAIDFTPRKDGDIAFACGMNMLRGAVVVE